MCFPQKRCLFTGKLKCVYYRKGHFPFLFWLYRTSAKGIRFLKMYLFKEHHYSCLFDNTEQKASTLPRYCIPGMSDLPRNRHFHSKPQVILKVPVKMKGGRRSNSHLLQLLSRVSFPWCVRGGQGWFVHRQTSHRFQGMARANVYLGFQVSLGIA